MEDVTQNHKIYVCDIFENFISYYELQNIPTDHYLYTLWNTLPLSPFNSHSQDAYLLLMMMILRHDTRTFSAGFSVI